MADSARRVSVRLSLDDGARDKQQLREVGETRVRVRTPDAGAAERVLAGLGLAPVNSPPSEDEDPWVSAPLVGSSDQPELIVNALVAAGVRIRGFSIEEPSLEERFVALTGEGFDVVQ